MGEEVIQHPCNSFVIWWITVLCKLTCILICGGLGWIGCLCLCALHLSKYLPLFDEEMPFSNSFVNARLSCFRAGTMSVVLFCVI